MRSFPIGTVLALAVALGAAEAAQGASVLQVGSGVDAYFGSQGTGYVAQDTNPILPIFSTPPTTGPLYTAGSPLPAGTVPLPPAPTPMVYGGTPFGNPFQGAAWSSAFNDGQPLASVAMAKSSIIDIYNPAATAVQDMRIDIPFWRFYQAPGATLYAYEQLNFYADYQVSMLTPLTGSSPVLPLLINASVVSGGMVQFDAAITYTWADFSNTSGTVGPPTVLGTIYYQWNATGGTYINVPVWSTGTLAPTPTGSTNGILELTGYAFIAGDPFEIEITPEPTSLSLLGLGAIAILRRRRRN